MVSFSLCPRRRGVRHGVLIDSEYVGADNPSQQVVSGTGILRCTGGNGKSGSPSSWERHRRRWWPCSSNPGSNQPWCTASGRPTSSRGQGSKWYCSACADERCRSVSPRDAALFGDFTAYDFTAWQPTVREVLARILSKRIVADIERALGVCLARSPSELQLSAWISLVDTFRTVAGERIAAVAGARERLERQQLQLQKRHRTRVSRG